MNILRDELGRFDQGNSGFWKGKHRDENTLEAMKPTMFKKGQKPWNKGKPMSEITKKRVSEAKKGTKSHRKGIVYEKEYGVEIANKIKKKMSEKAQLRLGEKNSFYGKQHTELTKNKISELRKGKCIGSENPAWLGGKSFEPYSPEFNDELKKKILKKHGYKCVECPMTNKEHIRKYKKTLGDHHIDYNKKNNDEDNLIPLCLKCHAKTNINRNYWTTYFQSKPIGGDVG